MATLFALGTVMLWAGLSIPEETNPYSAVRADPEQVMVTGLILCVIALLALVARHRIRALFSEGTAMQDGLATTLGNHPYVALFLVSFVVLFVEVMFIRYASSQFRIFAFYKNIPLVSCFLGLGLGCFLRKGAARHALWFLLWMLPLTAFLSQGALLVDDTISLLGATASSEFILGDTLAGGVEIHPLIRLIDQISVGLFCAATLAAIAGLFCLLGRLLGSAFENVPRIPGYTINILGSLAGIMLFVALSYLQTPPWVWYLAGLVPLLGWLPGTKRISAAAALIALCAVAVMPSRGETVWSPYQKLVGHHVDNGYWVQISDVFYQAALDLRPEAIAELGYNPAPHYSGVYQGIERPDRVLVVGAGTGNDVAAALRVGASHVDAVDIDPAIIAMGRRHHPERPYDDPRVTVVVDDARSAFRTLPAQSYDAVVFGVLDSHTQLGISSVRLDNYVFTLESFVAARRLLRPGGSLLVTAVDYGNRLGPRFSAMLEAVCDTPVDHRSYGGAPKSFVCQVNDPSRPVDLAKLPTGLDLPSDDWPFLYLLDRGVPQAYLLVLVLLVVTSVGVLWKGGLQLGGLTPYHGHMFFLGAAFLLMEVYAINRLALLFGTTWLVSAVTIGAVLLLIVLANLTVWAVPKNLQKLAYPALVICLVVSFGIDPGSVLGKGTGAALGYAVFILSPVYFAGLIFAYSFRTSAAAGPAIGANILGAVLGGWVEYATMATGIRAMALLALAFYLASLAALVIAHRRRKITELAEA